VFEWTCIRTVGVARRSYKLALRRNLPNLLAFIHRENYDVLKLRICILILRMYSIKVQNLWKKLMLRKVALIFRKIT